MSALASAMQKLAIIFPKKIKKNKETSSNRSEVLANALKHYGVGPASITAAYRVEAFSVPFLHSQAD